MFIEITSNSNPKIKHVKGLHRKKNRDRSEEYLIEGIRIIEHALDTKGILNSIFITKDLYDSISNSELIGRITNEKIETYIVNEQLFKEICDTSTPQGILGIANKKYDEIEDILQKENYFIIILDRLQDPGNVGTIIRTADAAGVDCIITTKGCVDIYNSKTIRSTMGSVFSIPIISAEDINDFINDLKDRNTQIVSTVLNTDNYHYDVNYGHRTAIIIGNEGNGIAEDLIEQSSLKVKIPILGKAESLNASVASSIIIYEVVRQRMNSENLKI